MKPFISTHRFKGKFFFGLVFWIICSSILIYMPASFKLTPVCGDTLDSEIHVIWNQTYEAPFVDEAQSIIKHPLGGYVISGWTNSSGFGDLDIFILRIGNTGNQIWNKTIGNANEDKGFEIINCYTGGYAVASTYGNTTALYNNTDFMVTRLADDGSTLWQKTYSGPNQTDTSIISDLGRSIVECPNGDFVLAGVTTTNDCDIWLFRISAAGTLYWQKTFHNRDIDRCYNPHSLVRCSDGGFAILGYTYSSATSNDVWLVKTDSSGNHLWNKTYGDEGGYQRPEGLVECADGGFGIIANTHTFSAGGADAWLIRTDSSGNQLWNKTYGGVEEDGGGYVYEMADGGFTIGGGTHSYDIGNGDAWLVRTDENGTLLWNHTVGDPYGNGMTSFVYDSYNTYVCTGGTNRIGEPFGDIWVFKCFILIVTPTITPTTSTPTLINSLPNIFSITMVFTLSILINKTRRRKID